MAATAWTFYNDAKKKIGNATIQLDAGIWKMQLHNSASNASTATLSILSEVTNEIAVAGGYADGGRTLAGVAWTTGGDPSSVKWDATDLIFTASGANLSIVKFAVIHNSVGAVTSGHLLCWSRLSTSEFSVTTGNTLTVQFASAGIFTLT
jgi:hypothetical protein